MILSEHIRLNYSETAQIDHLDDIQNPIINKELLEYNIKMLSKLTNEKIGENLLKIFSNFKKK